MKLEYTITAILDDELWGFSNLLNDQGELDEIAKENILDLISEDIDAAMEGCKQELKLIN